MLTLQQHADVLEVVLDATPIHALGAVMRKELFEAIEASAADSAIRAIVIRGVVERSSGGADITEFGQTFAEPWLPELVDRVEASEKPVIAVIDGTCFGGDLELALGCHYRIAAPSAKLALPEVKLGLLPGAGGTQRLPRMIGAQAALEMIVSGEPVSAARAAELGLVDKVAEEGALAAEAIAFAREVTGVRRTGDRAVPKDAGLFERFAAENARKIKGMDAPAACIEAIKAATELPLRKGLALERDLFEKLLRGEQSQGLRHIFFAERAAAKVQGLPKGTELRTIFHVGVIGAGTMGGGISMNFLSAGIPVTLVEMSAEALDCGVAVMRRNYEASAAKGKLTMKGVEDAMALLTPTLHFEALAACDLIIEAVYENLKVKQEIFRRLDAVAKPRAMLASNTSYLSIDTLAACTGRPKDVLGTHFFSPANVMKLVEVVRGAQTAPDALATAMDLARRIRKVPVVAGVCYGFIGNRMLIPRQDEATALLLDGATPEQIDRVHTAFGMPMGPFQMADLAGVDIGWHRDKSRIESIRDALCAEGRWGQKTKTGYYDYDEKRRPTPSPLTGEIITRFRERAGRTPRPIEDEEIVARTLYTMINEGAKILEEGIAQRASDIDVVWVYGYGWPAAKGGPMFWADTIGLTTVVQGLAKYRDKLGPNFTVSALLSERAASADKLDGKGNF